MQNCKRELKKASPNVYALSTNVIVTTSKLQIVVEVLMLIGLYSYIVWSIINEISH